MPKVIHTPIKPKNSDTNQTQETNPPNKPDDTSSSTPNPFAQTSQTDHLKESESEKEYLLKEKIVKNLFTN